MSSTGRRSPMATWLLLGAMVLVCVLFLGLGTWQMQRREWKLQLIATVQQRVSAEPAPLQDVIANSAVADLEYRRVRVRGAFLPLAPTLVQAVTRLGGGYWVLQAFRSDGGATLYVNRGFVPTSVHGSQVPPAPGAPLDLVGLLRRTEPGGGFLRSNDPAADRWFSRDVLAMARNSQLASVVPWFIDAEATLPGAGQPVGGLTVVQFRNAHLAYALTWFALAALAALGAGIVLREAGRGPRAARAAPGAAC